MSEELSPSILDHLKDPPPHVGVGHLVEAVEEHDRATILECAARRLALLASVHVGAVGRDGAEHARGSDVAIIDGCRSRPACLITQET